MSPRRARPSERYRRTLMKAPVPYTVVKDWFAQTRQLEASTADKMVADHLAGLCDSRTFGTWAHTASKWPPHGVEPFLSEVIRIAFLRATWWESLVGIFTALAFENVPHLPQEVWDAEVLSPPVMSAIADAAIAAHRGRRPRGQWRRALVLLTRTDLAAVIDDRDEGLTEVEIPAAGPKPAPTRPIPPVRPPQPPRVPTETAPLRLKQTQPKKRKRKKSPQPPRPSLQPVAAVVVRSRECRDVETYLAAAGKRDLTVETVFLATALTYRPQWRLLFEKPVSMKIGSRRISLTAVTATMGWDSIALRFSTADGRRMMPAYVNVDFRQRTYISGDASHVAISLLDLLFTDESRLIASRAVGDQRFAATRLEPDGQEAAAVYWLSDRPLWIDGGASGQLLAQGVSGSRRPHDVRGYRQTRDGKTHRVKPYHRSP